MEKQVVVTQVGVDYIRARETACKEALSSYECPICRKWVWWDEPHEHKVGQSVRF